MPLLRGIEFGDIRCLYSFRGFSGTMQGGFSVHPSDADLSLGTPVEEKAT
jgi:hypothetical protein